MWIVVWQTDELYAERLWHCEQGYTKDEAITRYNQLLSTGARNITMAEVLSYEP